MYLYKYIDDAVIYRLLVKLHHIGRTLLKANIRWWQLAVNYDFVFTGICNENTHV